MERSMVKKKAEGWRDHVLISAFRSMDEALTAFRLALDNEAMMQAMAELNHLIKIAEIAKEHLYDHLA
jgi:hypothetical protein